MEDKEIRKAKYFLSGIWIQDGKIRSFSGFIFRESDGSLSGVMSDSAGPSKIHDIMLFVETSFLKTYENGATFAYVFDKRDGDWLLGKFREKGSPVKGKAKIIFQEVNEKFFQFEGLK